MGEGVRVNQSKIDAKRATFEEHNDAHEEAQAAHGEKREEARGSFSDFKPLLEDLTGTRAAYLLDKEMNVLTKVPISELGNVLDDYRNVYALVFDGKVNQSIVDLAIQRKISVLVGTGYRERVTKGNVTVMTEEDF